MRRSLLTLLFLAFTLPALAVPQGPVIGKVTLTLGTVTGTDQDGDTFEVRRGADLYAGYSFETAARSLVRAELNDGTRFTLSQNSSASLDDFSFDAATATGGFNTTVERGGFKYVSGLLGSGLKSRVHSRISTPSGVIGVRGTTIEGEHGPNGLVINITTGTVEVTYSPPSGPPQTQVVGDDGETKIASVTIDGVATPLNEVPESLQVMVNTLVEMVDEAESGSDESGSEGNAEEEQEKEEGENEEESDEQEDADDEGDADEDGTADDGDSDSDDGAADNTDGQGESTDDNDPGDTSSNLDQGEGEQGDNQQQDNQPPVTQPPATGQSQETPASGGGITEEELEEILEDIDNETASPSTQT